MMKLARDLIKAIGGTDAFFRGESDWREDEMVRLNDLLDGDETAVAVAWLDRNRVVFETPKGYRFYGYIREGMIPLLGETWRVRVEAEVSPSIRPYENLSRSMSKAEEASK